MNLESFDIKDNGEGNFDTKEQDKDKKAFEKSREEAREKLKSLFSSYETGEISPDSMEGCDVEEKPDRKEYGNERRGENVFERAREKLKAALEGEDGENDGKEGDKAENQAENRDEEGDRGKEERETEKNRDTEERMKEEKTEEEEKEGEKPELSEEEINEKQKEAIREAFQKILRGEKLTDKEKGNLCEMLMDQYYISQGYKPLHPRVTSLDDKGHQGIDGVYEKEDANGKKHYVIADAKYGQSLLSTTVDGTKQMSDDWIDKRLDDAVGKEKADEIRDAYEEDPSSVSKEIYHYEPEKDSDGNTNADVSTVDEDGNKNHDKETVQTFDESGNAVT